MPSPCIGKIRFWFLLGVLLCAGGAFGQIQYNNLVLNSANGSLGSGYGGETGNTVSSNHSLELNGSASTSGFYYTPSFLNFQGSGFYDRAGSSAESSTYSDSYGFNAGAGIFGGSSMPGYVSLGQDWGQNGTYGLPSVGGPTSTNNDRSFSVAWMFRNLPVKNLMVYFTDSDNQQEVPGVGFSSDSHSKGFGASTGGYRVWGFALSGAYQHGMSDGTANVSGISGGRVTSSSSSNVFTLATGRSLPHNSKFTMSLYRISTNSSSEGDRSSSTSNEVTSSITSHVWRLPLSGSVSYNDNVYGSVLQELNAAGQLLDVSTGTPKIGNLVASVSSSYTLPHRVFVTAYLTNQEEFIGGASFGATSYGGNVGYGFGAFLKGLTVTVGMHDSATQAGNSGAGLISSASYNRSFGAWHMSAFANYSQGVQTQVALSTESSVGGSVSLRRQLLHRMSLGLNAGTGHSVFSNTRGTSSESKNAGANLSWMKQTISATYSQAGGSALITSQGLVPVTVPGLVSSQSVTYSGKSYNAGYSTTLIKNASLSATWGKFMSSGSGTGLLSNVSAETYSAHLTYTYRKLRFLANFQESKQGASSTTALPANIKTYYFGISRWFNFF